jgi:hypothetical protein
LVGAQLGTISASSHVAVLGKISEKGGHGFD